MKRREFLGIAAVGAAGLVLPVTARAGGTTLSPLAQPRLLGILRDADQVEALGASYRAAVPAENDAAALARALQSAVPGAGDAALAAALDRRVQRDFAEGRTVTLDGWVLSVTEARQCALFSLLPA